MDRLLWSHYKEIELSGSGSAETDINLKIDVSKESEMEDDFVDIRFTETDDTQLSQSRESYVNGTSAVYWIKVSLLPAGGKIIRMYYGNNFATLLSDGEYTFPFFDDFTGDDGDFADPVKWVVSDDDYVNIKDNDLKIQIVSGHLDQSIASVPAFGIGYAFKARMKKEVGGRGRLAWGLTTEYYYYSEGHQGYCDGAYHLFEIRRISISYFEIYIDGNKLWEGTIPAVPNPQNISFLFEGDNPNEPFWIDWAFVYKISESDPVSGDIFVVCAPNKWAGGSILTVDADTFYAAQIVSNTPTEITISAGDDLPILSSDTVMLTANHPDKHLDLSSLSMINFMKPIWLTLDDNDGYINEIDIDKAIAISNISNYDNCVYWYLVGQKIYLAIGDSGSASGNWTIGYFKLPVEATAETDEIDLPVEWHALAQMRTIGRILRKKEMYEEAKIVEDKLQQKYKDIEKANFNMESIDKVSGEKTK